jgi:CBS-domain-containing membrane protein
LVGGHFVAALLGTAITRLFLLDPSYQTYLDDNNFHTGPFFNGALSVAISLAIMLMMRVTHPP